jgi:signal recognition particle subunit SRP54
MGPLQGVLKMIPGMGQLAGAEVNEGQLKRVEAIVLSMTPHERAVPHAIDGRRRERIARGSGVTVPDVNQLLEARKMMEKVMKQLSSGKMPSLPGMPGMGGMPGAPGQTRHPGSKKAKAKRKSKRR